MFWIKSRSIFGNMLYVRGGHPPSFAKFTTLLGSTHVRICGRLGLRWSFSSNFVQPDPLSSLQAASFQRRDAAAFGTVSATFYARSEVPPNQPLAGGAHEVRYDINGLEALA